MSIFVKFSYSNKKCQKGHSWSQTLDEMFEFENEE